MWKKIEKILEKIYKFIFTPSNMKESIFQWMFRQFLPISDNAGNPSWTWSIAFATIFVYLPICLFWEINMAFTKVFTYDATTGKVLTESIRGVSTQFYAMLILLVGAVVYLIKFRGTNIASPKEIAQDETQIAEDKKKEDSTTGTIDTILDAAKNLLGK